MSQAEQILHVLKFGRKLTPLAALQQFGCLRLAARVYDLRRAGHKIQRATLHVRGKRFACYFLP